jgi:hypothetical protein
MPGAVFPCIVSRLHPFQKKAGFWRTLEQVGMDLPKVFINGLEVLL